MITQQQFTEEEARNGICIFLKDYYDIETEECIRLMKLEKVNLIRKSDLEILIEEAERAYDDFAYEYDNPGVDTSWSNTVACIKSQQRCIQAMKAELNKRRGG